MSKETYELLEKDMKRHLGQSSWSNELGSKRFKELVVKVGTRKKKKELMRHVGWSGEEVKEWKERLRIEVC